jgi:hypothetical protein
LFQRLVGSSLAGPNAVTVPAASGLTIPKHSIAHPQPAARSLLTAHFFSLVHLLLRVIGRNHDQLNFILHRFLVKLFDLALAGILLLCRFVVNALKDPIFRAGIDYAGKKQFALYGHMLFQNHAANITLGCAGDRNSVLSRFLRGKQSERENGDRQ